MDAGVQVDLVPLLGGHNPKKKMRLRRSGKNSSSLISSKFKCLLLALLAIVVTFCLVLLYHCPNYWANCQQQPYKVVLDYLPKPKVGQEDVNFVSYESIQQDNFEFHLNGSDVMVFLHIQKTGGTTFGKHLVQDIDLESPCLCRRRPGGKKGKKSKKYNRAKRKLKCDCFRPDSSSTSSNWLFSRYSTGWKCGLHPDWTELTECVDSYLDSVEGRPASRRRYFYITFLRDPVDRYLSEFRHVQRGATWKTATHNCNGRPATRMQIPPCYDDFKYADWSGVTLRQFMTCPSNLAVNRQTRMLADLKLVNCYNTSTMSKEARDRVILNSAKTNLEKHMAFFGLTEQQTASQFMFQHTFDLKFRVPFKQYAEGRSSSARLNLDSDTVEQIKEINQLDVQLYEFAQKIMKDRYEAAKLDDDHDDDDLNYVTSKETKLNWD